jgi:hypothetical protein
MLRRALFLALGFCVVTLPAAAQTRVYVAGDVFADITRFSRLTGPDPSLTLRGLPGDDVSAGGGARIGLLLSPAWSLELGADLGTTQITVETATIGPPILLPPTIPVTPTIPIRPPITFETRSSARFSAISVLIGYHPPAAGRIRPGFRGGVSIMHRRDAFTVGRSGVDFAVTSFPRIVNTNPTGGIVNVTTLALDEYTTVANVLTATLAAEAAVALSERAAVVPELRVHAGGLGAILLRPGVAVRWTF